MLNKLKKILGLESKKQEIQENIKLDYRELPGFIKKETQESRKLAKKKIRVALSEIYSNFEEIKKKLTTVKKSEPDAEMPPRRKFDFKIRDRFCDNVISAINKLEKPKSSEPGFNRNSVIKFLDDCSSVFKKMEEVSPKSSAWIMFLYRERMKDTGIVVKNTQNQINELNEFLNNDGKILVIEAAVENLINDIEKNKSEISGDEQKINEIETKIDDLTKKLVIEKEKIAELNNSNEFAELKKQEDKIKDKKADALNIEQQINNAFSGTHRIMKKFRHIDAGIDKEFTSHLDFYLESPVESYVSESPDDRYNIHKILSKINKAIERKSIDINKRDRKHWTELMNILERGELIKQRENLLKIEKEIEKEERIYKKINISFNDKTEKIKKEIEKFSDKSIELNNQLTELKNSKSKSETCLENNMESLENTVASVVKPQDIEIIY